MIFPMMAGIIVDWLIGAVADLLIGLIDTVCYGLLTVAYNIFYAVAQIDLFGGGTAGDVLYTEITKRLYMILSIVMVFVFAYHLIMLIIDPEGKGKGASSQIVKDTLFSIVLLIVLPLVYRYMSMFQFHVLENNTIPAIILGTNGGSETENPGKSVAQMVLISFFHPSGTTYNTFYNENGKLKSNAVDECVSEMEAENGKGDQETCEHYVAALRGWTDKVGVTSLTWNDKKLRHWVQDTMSYTWVISSIAALAVAWVFFLYAIDIGVRAVKLGVLQLISPIPVVLRIFPNTKKSFETWLNHMKKTYLELFIRVAIIFFALEIVKLVPTFIGIIFQSQSSSVAGPFTKCVATVILIFGILKFGQDAPALFKELFSVGGNLLSGVKLNPLDPKTRITDNKAAMWGIGKTASGFGGYLGEYRRQKQANLDAALNPANQGRFISGLKALPSGLRGVVSGVKQKNTTPTDLSRSALRQTVVSGADAGHKNFSSNQKLQDKAALMEDKLRYDRLMSQGYNSLTPEEQQFVDTHDADAMKQIKQNMKAARKQDKEDAKQYRHDAFERAISYDSTSNTASSLTSIVDGLKNLKGKVDTKKIDKEIEELQSIVNKSTTRFHPGNFNMKVPQNTGDQAKYEADMRKYETAKADYNRRLEEYNKYEEAERLLKSKKLEKNKKIADTLDKEEARQFTVESLSNVISEIKKSPSDVARSQLKQVEKIAEKANTGSLEASDIQAIGDIIDKLGTANTFSNAYADLLKTADQKASTNNSGSKSNSSSSGDKK